MRRLHLLNLFELLSMEAMLGEKMGSPSDGEGWTKTSEEVSKEGMRIRRETWTSKDGTSTYVRTFAEPAPDAQKEIKFLEQQMLAAVEKEEFEKAAEIRDRISELKK